VAAGVLSGFAPALQAGRRVLISSLRDRSGTAFGGVRLRKAIVTAQIAFMSVSFGPAPFGCPPGSFPCAEWSTGVVSLSAGMNLLLQQAMDLQRAEQGGCPPSGWRRVL
jgi:hypothetical protein